MDNISALSLMIQIVAPIATLCYGVWFIASIDKRLSLLYDRVSYMHNDGKRSYSDMKNKVENLEAKIERIYYKVK